MSVDSVSGFYLANLKELGRQRNDRYRELVSGGKIAPWYEKTAAQIQTHVESTGIATRAEAFDIFTASAEGTLRTRVAGLDRLLEVAQKIRVDFLPGNRSAARAIPGLLCETAMLKDAVYGALNFRFGENGYVFGGCAGFTPPVEDIRDLTGFPGLAIGSPPLTAADFSRAVPGVLEIYINENGDTLNLDTVSASSPSVVALVNALMLLTGSATGRDEQAAAASAQAAIAYDMLVNDRESVLWQLNLSMAKKEEREAQKELALDIDAQTNDVSPEESLAKIAQADMLETANREILLRRQKNSREAARMMERVNG